MKNLVIICVFLTAAFAGAQDAVLFNQGKESYKAEHYNEAIQDWKTILKQGNHSASVYFNIANAHYKLNEVGSSIYYYEKALQLAPNDKGIKANLAFAENAKVDAIAPLPKTIFSKWYRAILTVLTFDGWALTAVCFSSLFALLFLGYYFVGQEQQKRLLFTVAMVCAFLCIGTFTMASLSYQVMKKNVFAIIFAETTAIKTAPNRNSESALVLHEGTKVQILEVDDLWLRVRVANGVDGWLMASDLKKL
jgi:tetratricopeptide (TPR) repeat protein